MKQEILALKCMIAEQFQEYLLWKQFIVRTSNNQLTYIMTTPNSDATWYQWVEPLARFTFSIEYQKGWDNVVQMPWTKTHQSWMQGPWSPSWTVTVGTTDREDPYDLVVAETDEEIHKQVQETG